MPSIRGLASASVASSSRPPSPTLSTHTTATNVGLPATRLPSQLINRADLRQSLSAYEAILAASKTYTQALIALGAASSELATALEGCSRLKGAHDVGSGLLASSGVHHMASNSWSILADTFWKDTSIPLMEHHDLYVQACAERTLTHEKVIVQKSKALNEAEKRNQKESRSKIGRDLGSFRRALLELQRLVDDLDEEKARYYADVLEGEEECWSFVQEKMIASMRNQLDMFERISSKGLSDPVLEPLLSSIADPFSAYGPPRRDDQIFSILDHGTLLGVAGHSPDPSSHDTNAPATEKTGRDATGKFSSIAGSGDSEQRPLTSASLIMSPSTPSKGLSRVASGAASPKLNGGDSANGANGLGISLTTAAELARRPAPQAATSTSSSSSASQTGNQVDPNAELFGTDGEDDGGDEASIFSGAEDDPDNTANGVKVDGQNGKQSLGMAARIMQEKKRRRENAVRANAKTRLKHALSTIDESKGNTATAEARVPDTPTESVTHDSNDDQPEDDDKTISGAAAVDAEQARSADSGRKQAEPHESDEDEAKKSPASSDPKGRVDAEHQQEHDVDSVWN